MKNILTGLITAYMLTSACTNNNKYGKAIWNNHEVYTIENLADTNKIKPDYVNYAIKINNTADSIINITSDNLYAQINGTGNWKKEHKTFEQVEELERITGYRIKAVRHNDTLYTITDENIRIGLEGIGGYYPLGKEKNRR